MSDIRIASDSLGQVEVPATALLGRADAAVSAALQHWAGPDSLVR